MTTALHIALVRLNIALIYSYCILNNIVSTIMFLGLSRNSKLRWLNLRNNNVSSLDTGLLERLPELRHLSMENNCIRSLRGLQVGRLYFYFKLLERKKNIGGLEGSLEVGVKLRCSNYDRVFLFILALFRVTRIVYWQ